MSTTKENLYTVAGIATIAGTFLLIFARDIDNKILQFATIIAWAIAGIFFLMAVTSK